MPHKQTKWGVSGSKPTPNVEIEFLRTQLTYNVCRQQDAKIKKFIGRCACPIVPV